MATLHAWPGGDDFDDGKDDPHNQHSLESGPLGPIDQATGELDRRLTRRWSEPLQRQTDEVEVLSALDADLVRRFLAPPPQEPEFLGTRQLPPLPALPDLPPAPVAAVPHLHALRVTHEPSGQRAQPAIAVATPPPSARPRLRAVPLTAAPPPATAPLNVTRLVTHSFHIAMRADFLPPSVLAMMDIPHRRIWLAPALAPVQSTGSEWGDYATRLERAIEARPFTRYLLATLWTRWYCEPPAEAPHAQTLIATFAPADGLTQHTWQRWHGDYYTWLWNRTNTLVATHDRLDLLTMSYLSLGDVLPYEVPTLGPARVHAVQRHALRVLPALRAACHTPDEFLRAAWNHYGDYLARSMALPRAIVTGRLEQDTLRIRTSTDLCDLTDALLAESPELGAWRDQVARSAGLYGETSPHGVYRTAAQRVALWLAEPSYLLHYPRFP